jgi:hypothetical protein
MKVINRNLFIIKPKQPFAAWINNHFDLDITVTLDEIHQDCTVYLIPDMYGEEDAREYIQNWKVLILEMALNSWYTDPTTWPQNRTPEMADLWLNLEYHSMVIDLEDAVIEWDEY